MRGGPVGSGARSNGRSSLKRITPICSVAYDSTQRRVRRTLTDHRLPSYPQAPVAERRRTVAVDYCLNRAAECEKLAELAPERSVRTRYRQLAATWLRLARNTEFT